MGTDAVTQTDVRAAVGLGLVEARSADTPAALQQVIERRLVLSEVARFPPAEPSAAAIDQQVADMKKHAGPTLTELMLSTGLDEARLREQGRDTIRIQAYLAQRFGTSTQVGDEEVRKYYDAHRDQFMRDGVLMPFQEAEVEARQKTSAERLGLTITQWLRDLRTRSGVVFVERAS